MSEPRIVTAPTEAALFDLLTSLNEAGEHPEVACTYPQGGAVFTASLSDADYAGSIHYGMHDVDSGLPHCHSCSECRGACEYDKPGFPVIALLTRDPDPASTLDEPFDAWWRETDPNARLREQSGGGDRG